MVLREKRSKRLPTWVEERRSRASSHTVIEVHMYIQCTLLSAVLSLVLEWEVAVQRYEVQSCEVLGERVATVSRRSPLEV